MKRYGLFFIVLLVWLWAGCDDSEHLTPTEGMEPGYTLPQGDHDYDKKIVDWFDRCGFYILYKFTPRDVYFNMGRGSLEMKVDTVDEVSRYSSGEIFEYDGTVFVLNTGEEYKLGEHEGSGGPYNAYFEGDEFVVEKRVVKGSATANGFRVEQADEAYVGKQLAWLEEIFLNHYSDDFLREYMPLKLILGKNLITYVNDQTPPEESGFTAVSNVFVVSHGDEMMDEMDDNDKRESKSKMNHWFLSEKLFDKIYKLAEAEGFFSFTDYNYLATIWLTDEYYYPNGLVCYGKYVLGWGMNATQMKQEDLRRYLGMAVDYSFNMLNDKASDEWWNQYDCTGIFDKLKDTEGLIRKKYDILVKALNGVGIDLRGIGDMFAPY